MNAFGICFVNPTIYYVLNLMFKYVHLILVSNYFILFYLSWVINHFSY